MAREVRRPPRRAHYYPDDYYAFALANDSWLNDYALYMALKTANGMKSWTEWPREYRLRDAAALAKFAAEQEEEIGFWKFLQYEFATQWKKVKDYANAKGVKILGDIPIYVSADSVDAWVGGELFELDAQEALLAWPAVRRIISPQTASSGATRCITGRIINRRDTPGGSGASATPSASTTCSASTTSAVSTPTGPSRRAALYRLHRQVGDRPPDGLVPRTEAALGKLPIIAEDLGELFPSVRELLADSTFPGMKVLQFAFGGGDNEYLPHNHVKNSVVYPGTHDNTTLTDWWENAATGKEKANAAAYLHLTPCKPTAKEVVAVKPDAARIALPRAALGLCG